MSFIRHLIESIKEKRSAICMGLDPRLDKEGQIPEYLKEEFETPNGIILEFNKALIDHTSDLIPVIKPQMAFYEKYEALKALKETIKYAHKKDLLVILDAKRNDIGSTCEAYAYSLFKNYHADACTINAYFGIDGVKPFLDYKNKGIFILVKTSNPSSGDFQNLFAVRLDDVNNKKSQIRADGITLERNYLHMANLVNRWSKTLEKFSNYCNLGVVAGATYPDELKILRKTIPNSMILIPGYGAQGATAEDIKHGFDNQGLGAIVNSSRGIMFAYQKNKIKPEHFDKAARTMILKMKKRINKKINLSKF